MSFTRSIVLAWPGSKSITPPVNAGGWSSVGSTSIGMTIVPVRAAGSEADSPSVTVNESDAGPKYPGSLRNRRVSSSTTRSVPSLCEARTVAVSVMRTGRPDAAIT